MEFTLFYKGNIRTQDPTKVKHDLRLGFHDQLKSLLQLPPLIDHKEWFKPPYPEKLHKKIDNKDFLCLVSHHLKMYVELKFELLCAYKSRSFKDIDNKLKIICDSLQIPREKTNIPPGWVPSKFQTPLLCLMWDDKLIYKLSVDTDYILKTGFFNNNDEMVCLIKVKIRGNKYHPDFNDLLV